MLQIYNDSASDDAKGLTAPAPLVKKTVWGRDNRPPTVDIDFIRYPYGSSIKSQQNASSLLVVLFDNLLYNLLDQIMDRMFF
jgi:hypothetical protein